ncbi:sigma-70 family RNA polymerase sigma factor [Achromobacter seleniivolatilans]|uniref:Sigma-70 family RNA polymerase sigma factor n=1 Tax=Achromobacter seleniivolatilans TaxID=3047478 RepID=A0ABY9M5Y9_9BURK|nr:sigma-70 family RNA polymerase sigma factor [Achromobacter sp. R39]WMD22431.1 sigma-70 family RNA polymerase sigma factor [Achromobacter sp. R39]
MPSSEHFSFFQRLYAAQHPWLRTWLQRKLRCRFNAEDIAQETFLRLLRRGGLDQILEPRALLTTTATRLIIDDSRRREIEQAYVEIYAAQHGGGTAPSAESVAAAVQTVRHLAEVIERLPAKAGQAFLMSTFDGMTHPEIAAVLRVSDSAIKQYIARALLVCHDVLTESAGERTA